MKKSSNKKDNRNLFFYLIILGMLFAISGITFGMAAISKQVVIESNTKIKFNETDFKVNFSSNPNTIMEDPISPITIPSNVEASKAIIDNSGDEPVIRNLSAEFNAPGESVTYKFYILNSGKYAAYLKSINFLNITGDTVNKSCKTTGIVSQEAVDKACEGINISVKVGKEEVTYSTVNNINNNILLNNNYETIIVTISYEEDSLVAEGDFNVNFGDITLKYNVFN